MNPQEQAQHYYKTAFNRWALELSYEKNHLIAKSIAVYLVEQIIDAYPHTYDLEQEYLRGGGASVNVIKNIRPNMGYWRDVLIQINEIRGYDNIHDADDSINS
jgi:hypothetical protein